MGKIKLKKTLIKMINWQQLFRSTEPLYTKKEETPALTDSTVVGGNTWKALKRYAMAPDYDEHRWYQALNSEEKQLIEELRDAQNA